MFPGTNSVMCSQSQKIQCSMPPRVGGATVCLWACRVMLGYCVHWHGVNVCLYLCVKYLALHSQVCCVKRNIPLIRLEHNVLGYDYVIIVWSCHNDYAKV